ncbi:Crp/Fnr family transcriptional regulator [Acinetobacter sp.]|uniref:Crp/Fnr family transcriptional regulator n=1 Tax=Acinetobacter sp. TaxID=472 RepID=UPI0028B24327|nr:Crp/Fnr family transcriptional regulator [Acinetobacter sp.]
MSDQKNTTQQHLLQILRNEDIFQGFCDQTLEQLVQQVKYSRFHAQQHILKQQQIVQDIYILLSGTLQIGWLQNNGELIVNDYIRRQSVFNFVALLQQKPLNYDYFAATHVEVAIISGTRFLAVLQRDPKALWNVVQSLSRRMYLMFEHNRYLRTATLEQRIARHLIRLYEQYGCRKEIPLKLSQQEFAESFNISRQTLNKHLQQFVQTQVIAWNYGQIVILDLERLRRMSELDE